MANEKSTEAVTDNSTDDLSGPTADELLAEIEILSEKDDYPLEHVFESPESEGVRKQFDNAKEAEGNGCQLAQLKQHSSVERTVDSCVKSWHGVGSGEGHNFERIWVAIYELSKSGAFIRRYFLSREDKYTGGKVELLLAFSDGRQLIGIERCSGWGTGFQTTDYELVGWNEGEYMPIQSVFSTRIRCHNHMDGRGQASYATVPVLHVPGQQEGMDPVLYSSELLLRFEGKGAFRSSALRSAEYLLKYPDEEPMDEFVGKWTERWVWDEEQFEFILEDTQDSKGSQGEMRRKYIDLCESG